MSFDNRLRVRRVPTRPRIRYATPPTGGPAASSFARPASSRARAAPNWSAI